MSQHTPNILPAAHALPQSSNGFTILSYNVLLPNSGDGWWVYKYYQPHTPQDCRTWSHRQSLLRAQLLQAGADVICLQEASAETFEADFAFLSEAGYDCVLHRKFRFRSATFWKRDRFSLIYEGHKDKVLITTLELTATSQHIHVLNCHLTAGPSPQQRLRQVFGGLDQVRKELKRNNHVPENAAVVVCGDFNSNGAHTAVRKLLHEGSVDGSFREPHYPEIPVTKKGKRQVIGAFKDVYEQAYNAEQGRPATFVVPLLDPHYIDRSTGQLTPGFLKAARAFFELFAGSAEVMDRAAVDAWLMRTNKAITRGSELREALAIFEHKGEETLTFEELLGIYERALRDGKFWSVHYDFCIVELAPPGSPSKQPYATVLDYIYYTPSTLKAVAVQDPLTDDQKERVFLQGDALPNAWHPSDHLPIAAVFELC